MGNAEYMGTHPIFESDFDCLTECCLDSPPDQPAHWSPPQSRSTAFPVHMLLLPTPPPSLPDKRKPSPLIWPNAVLIVSFDCFGPIDIAMISFAILASFMRTASSTAISQNGFIECLTESLTTPEPSGLTRILTA